MGRRRETRRGRRGGEETCWDARATCILDLLQELRSKFFFKSGLVIWQEKSVQIITSEGMNRRHMPEEHKKRQAKRSRLNST